MPNPRNLQPESQDYHRKAQQNVRLSDDGVASLRTLANFYGLGYSGVIEMLVREKVHEKSLNVSSFLKPSKPARPSPRSKKR